MRIARQSTPSPQAAAADSGALVLERTLPAPPERVFEAWTRPELLRRWFGPGPTEVEEVEIDARVGGAYRVLMRGPDGKPHTPTGVFEELVPGRRLVFTWRWEGDELVTRVTVELRPAAGGSTRMTLTHEGLADAEMRGLHERGWTGCLEKLPGLLEAGAAAGEAK